MHGTFHARLRGLGMTYPEYLASDIWREKRRQYRESSMPQTCVVCGYNQVDLHHISYARLGFELLADLLPLCREHHFSLHDCERDGKTQLHCVGKLLRTRFGWTKAQVRERLAPWNWNGIRHVDNIEALTPKQLAREARKGRVWDSTRASAVTLRP